ncbi:MAG: hypothetical protein PHR61_03085 [Candidatus Absconditabacteria bacterium]|nr:hypothetical protein [Candidatus Absconditabacteria bacterium]
MQNNNHEQQNEELIQKLMDQQTINQESKDEEQISISTARVSSIKYRLYVLIFLALIAVGIIDYVIPNREKTIGLRSTIEDKQQQITNFLTKQAQYEKDKDLIGLIEIHESKIISCVNYKVGCTEIPQEIRDNFGFARSYLQLNNLHDPKMEINEKIILANINEYLLKKVSQNNNENSPKIGKITNISIGEPKVVVSQLYSIPIKLEASFENKDYLLSFIENVDKNVLESKSYRILYKIDEINYNIMEYDQEQLVGIKISAFYYKE